MEVHKFTKLELKLIRLMPATEGEMYDKDQEGYFYEEIIKVAKFIEKALSQSKKDVIREIKELKVKSMASESPAPYYHVGYEKALDDILLSLKDKE